MIYQSKNNKSVLFINFKCGYSSIQSICDEGKLDLIHNSFRQNNTNFSKYYKVAIIRDTKKRLESFYKSKFINNELEQVCQKSMQAFYKKKDISFGEMMMAIKRGYKDNHIIPQSTIIPKKCDHLIDLDNINANDEKILKLHFNISLNDEHRGKTSDMNFHWAKWMEDMISIMYKQDILLYKLNSTK